jgi:flagellar biosynthesis protein FliP
MKSWAEKVLETVDCFDFLKCKLYSMVTANLKFINEISLFLSFFTMFYIKNKITKDSYSRSKNLTAPFAENKHVQS